MLIENIHEKSLVAQRQVYDGIRECGGILSVNIDKNLVSNIRMANIHLRESLLKIDKIEDRRETERQERKRALDQIKRLQEKKKAKLEEEAT